MPLSPRFCMQLDGRTPWWAYSQHKPKGVIGGVLGCRWTRCGVHQDADTCSQGLGSDTKGSSSVRSHLAVRVSIAVPVAKESVPPGG